MSKILRPALPALELIPEIDNPRKEVAPTDSDEHGQKDPQRQKSIEKGKPPAEMFLNHGFSSHFKFEVRYYGSVF